MLISPGERYDVMVTVDGPPGTELALVNEAYDRGHDSGGAAPMEVMRFALSTEARRPAKTAPSAFPETARLPDPQGGMGVELDEVIRGEDVVFTIKLRRTSRGSPRRRRTPARTRRAEWRSSSRAPGSLAAEGFVLGAWRRACLGTSAGATSTFSTTPRPKIRLFESV